MPHKMPPAEPMEPHEKKPPKEKRPRRRRRFPVFLLLLLLLAAIIAYIIIVKPFGSGGFGFGPGGSSGSGSGSDPGSAVESVANTAVIRIDGNDIFLDDSPCKDVSELEEKITAIGTDKDYILDHEKAIKSTYDEVKQMLSGLEEALSIKVNYNE